MNRDINMGTENRTNEMNMNMTGRMPRAKKMRRRILALTCALAIALLQCAVIMTVGTEEVSAASQDVKVKAISSGKYGNDIPTDVKTYKVVTTTIPVKGGGEPVDPEDPTSPTNPKTVEGVKVSSIKQKVGLSDGDAGLDDDDVLVKNGDSYEVYKKSGDVWEAQTTHDSIIEIDMGKYDPVESISVNPSSLSLGRNKSGTLTATINYKQDIFNYSGSDAKYVKLKWSVTNKNATVTVNKSDQKKATVKMGKKGGAYAVNILDENSGKNTQVKDDGKGATTTTTTTTKSKTKSKTKTGTKKPGTTKYRHTTSKYRTFATRSPGASTATTTTGTTTVPTVTYTPDRTITVKEVYLGQEIQEEQQQNPYEEMYEDPYATDESSTTNDWEDMDTSVDFGPAASSAAAAAAVCGAGAIGRIRRFRVDTKTVVSAASQAGNQTTAQAGPETEKKSRLSRFKKS